MSSLASLASSVEGMRMYQMLTVLVLQFLLLQCVGESLTRWEDEAILTQERVSGPYLLTATNKLLKVMVAG